MFKVNIPLLVVMMLVGSVSLYGKNIFNQAESLEHALKIAKSKRKLLLTYVAQSSAPCCIAMENATFRDPDVKNLIKKSFYPVKITVSDSLGKHWSNQFQISNTPTLLFFDAHGTLIKQVENALSSSELKSILAEVLFFNKNGFWPIEIDQPVVLTVSVPNQQDNAATSYSMPEKNTKEEIPTVGESSNADGNYFSVLLEQVPTNDPTVRNSVHHLKRKFPQHLVKVKLCREDQIPFYQIWVGEFQEFTKADRFLEALHREGFSNAQLISTSKPTP